MDKIYFDETNNNKKIGVTKNNTLRFKEDAEYFFLYAFLELSDEKLSKIAELERQFKLSRGIPREKELKTKHIVKKHISNMSDIQMSFYQELFKIIKNDGNLVNIGFLMKLEPFIRVFRSAKFLKNIYGVHKEYFYSLEKYLSTRRLLDINRLLTFDITMKQIHNQITQWLLEDMKRTPRLEERSVFKTIYDTTLQIKKFDKRKWSHKSLKWNYDLTALSLASILDERKAEQVDLVYDKFKELDELWATLSDQKDGPTKTITKGEHSKNNIGLRVVDWFIGLLRRLIIDINIDHISARGEFGGINNLNTEVVAFMNDNVDFFIAMRNVLSEDHWSTFSNTYSDDFLIAIFALNDIKKNNKISIDNVMIRLVNSIENL